MDVRIVGGDQNRTPVTAAEVLNLDRGKPLRVIQAGPSGESYNLKSSTANFDRVNVGTSATQIIASNPNRLGFLIQNLDAQQLAIGFSNSVTIQSAGAFLSPIQNSSGDGGSLSVTDYTGSVFGIVASGDADVLYQEFVK